MAFAGLWEDWRVPEGAVLRGSLAERRPGDVVETFAILTTEANAAMRALHHRMPVILEPGAAGAWLSGGEVPLAPFPEAAMTSFRVSSLVNSARYDDPRCIEPLGAG